MPRKTKIQIRRDTGANWSSVNPTLANGELGFEKDKQRLKIGDGETAWTSLPYQNAVETSFAVVGGSAGTQPTFTGSPLFTGSYARNGDLVHFQIQVDMDNITGFGTGQYYVELPFTSKYGYKFRDGCLHDISTGREYAIGGHVAAGSDVLQLFSTDTQSGKVYDIAFTYNNPVTLATADNFHIAGTYIVE